MRNANKFEAERLISLDFFRGITMFLLVIGSTHLSGFLVSPQLKGTFIFALGEQLEHHPWHGLRFWDLIQPFFMFIVGVAMPFSFANRIKKGDSYKEILRHILKRSFLLFILGWGLYCIPSGTITFYFQDVLTQLSVTILISFLIMRKPAYIQILFSFGLLAITELLYRSFWIEGFNQPFVAGHNFGTWFDSLYSGVDTEDYWVSFNAIPTAAHTIWGVLAGKLLMSDKTKQRKLLILVLAGIAGLIVGYGLNPITPIIKRIATSSFVLTSGGWAFLALSLSFWLIDMMKLQRGVSIFTVVGMNSLFIYLFSHIGGAEMAGRIVAPFTWALFSWTGTLYQVIATSLFSSFLLWYLCYWMYKQKIFIKI